MNDTRKVATGRNTAQRLESVEPSEVREIHNLYERLRRERPNERFIPLHFGESDLGTPDFIVEAGRRALAQGAVFYETNSGRIDLRKRLVDYFGRQYGLDLSIDHFVVSCGAMQAIYLALVTLVDPGQTVLNITPAWPNFTQAARLAGARVHELPLRFDAQRCLFTLDFSKLEHAFREESNVRMLIVNTPSNPTGWVMSMPDKQRLLECCRRHGVFLLTDEIYDRIVFNESARPESFLSLKQEDDRLVVVNGFAKTYCMTGWRLGYLITEPALAAKMAQMQEFITSHAPSVAQVAAITALREGESFVEQSRQRYWHLRDVALECVGQIPQLAAACPEGTFYLFF